MSAHLRFTELETLGVPSDLPIPPVGGPDTVNI